MTNPVRALRVPGFPGRGGKKLFFGWWVVAGGVGITTLVTALFTQAYGAYIVLLRQEFDWSKTMLSAAFSAGQLQSGAVGPVQGYFIDKLGPRTVASTGIVIMGLGLMGFAFINSLTTFFIAVFITFVGWNLCGFLPVTVAVVNWFERKRATAIAILTMGVAIGGIVVPITVFCMEQFGWRPTAFASGVLLIAAGLPLGILLRHRPEAYGYRVDGDPPPATSAPRDGTKAQVLIPSQPLSDFTVRQAVHTYQFWFIACGHGSALLVVSAVMVHLVPHINESRGYSLGIASLAVAALTLFQAFGSLVGGFLGDRYSKRMIAAACMFVHAGALLILAFAPVLPLIFLSVILHGAAWGARGPLMTAIRADYFGRAHYGSILGLSQPIVMFGMAAGPILAGATADATGTYEAGFTVLAVLAAAGSAFFIFAPKPTHPDSVAA